MTVRWRIWYADGTVFDSSMGEPEDAPIIGVICITNHDPDENGTGCNTQRGEVPERGSFFVWDEANRRWFAADMQGLMDWCFRSGMVKWGRYIPTAQYREILFAATHDRDFKSKPPKPEHKGM